MFYEGFHTYCTYILTNRNKTVLYVGVTNSHFRRLAEHKDSLEKNKRCFTSRFKCIYLVYYEQYQWVQDAISREKIIKGWTRDKKEALINENNSEWRFLNQHISQDFH